MKTLKYLFVPLMIPHLIVYALCPNKPYILSDLQRFSLDYWQHTLSKNGIKLLIKVLLFCPEYRNIYYHRISPISKKFHIGFLLETILPSYKFLSIGVLPGNIGKGFFIQHGNSTIVHASSIGDNCWVNQNVTIGDNGRGIPTIGNNVRIGTGAVVLGPITVGDNVIIGANATVVKSVPANCTVVPSPSYIIKRNGISTYEKL